MKRLLLTLATVVATVILGCQESDLTSPPAPDPTLANRVSKATVPSSVIPLQGIIKGPSARYWIDGQVKYTLTQLPIMSRDLFDLVLDVEAKITQVNSKGASLKVSNSSSEKVNLTGQNSVMLDKWYFLRGGPSSLGLHVEFAVAATGITVTLIAIE